MPLFGTLDITTALAASPTIEGFTTETWELPGATVLQVSHEVDEDDALAVTPPALHPSIPPYATFSFLHAPTSPVGPFTMAMVRLVVRAGIRPRGLLIRAFVDNPDAAAALGDGWGYRIEQAGVSLSRRHDRVVGSVTIDGVIALTAALGDPEPIAGADVELFDNLHLTNVAGTEPVIAQIDPSYAFRSADRGRAELTDYHPDLLGVVGITPVYPVVAVCCVADIELAPPRFVMDPSRPAVHSTRRLQRS